MLVLTICTFDCIGRGSSSISCFKALRNIVKKLTFYTKTHQIEYTVHCRNRLNSKSIIQSVEHFPLYEKNNWFRPHLATDIKKTVFWWAFGQLVGW